MNTKLINGRRPVMLQPVQKNAQDFSPPGTEPNSILNSAIKPSKKLTRVAKRKRGFDSPQQTARYNEGDSADLLEDLIANERIQYPVFPTTRQKQSDKENKVSEYSISDSSSSTYGSACQSANIPYHSQARKVFSSCSQSQNSQSSQHSQHEAAQDNHLVAEISNEILDLCRFDDSSPKHSIDELSSKVILINLDIFEPLSLQELHHQRQEQLNHIIVKLASQSKHYDYFHRQVHYQVEMRSTLVNWVMEVCSQMRFQRITCHLSIALIDDYFQNAQYLIPIDQFQTIGVAAIFIASKMEEICLTDVQVFSKVTGFSSSVHKICLMERRMLNVLRFNLHPVTLHTWTDLFTQLWDQYACDYGLHNFTENGDASLRLFTEYSYLRIRQIYQVIDALATDFKSKLIDSRQLVAATIYLVIGGQQGMLVLPQDSVICAQIGQSCIPIQSLFPQMGEQIKFYNDQIMEPFMLTIGLKLTEMSAAIRFAARYFNLQFDHTTPDQGDILQKGMTATGPENCCIQEYIGLQTYNESMKDYVDGLHHFF